MSPHYHNQPSLFSHLPSSVKGALALQEGGQGQKPDISYPGGGPPQGPILGAVGGDLGSTLKWQWARPGGLEVSAQGGLGIPLCWSWACCSQIPAPPFPCISFCRLPSPDSVSVSTGFRLPGGECRVGKEAAGDGPSLPAWSSYGPAPPLAAITVPAVPGDPSSPGSVSSPPSLSLSSSGAGGGSWRFANF